MARVSKKWLPSEKQLQTYEELLRTQNIVRKAILRKREATERDRGSTSIPDLVVPKRATIHRNKALYGFSSYKDFLSVIREKKRLYGEGLKSFYRETYKKNILQAWRDGIESASGEVPEGNNGRFTKEQIQNSDMGEYMEMYNRFIAMKSTTFQDMYDKGYIVPFKYLYNEMVGSYKTSYLEEQRELIETYRSVR